MKVTARQQDFLFTYGDSRHLLVRSNPLGAIRVPFSKSGQHLANSITVRIWDETFGMWSHDAIHYPTITDFVWDWRIESASTRHIRVPFLHHTIGLGDAFAFFAEKLPLWFKMKFNGCLDRREWWNWLVQFTPLHPERALVSQAVFDSVMDIRRALRERGENPFDYEEAPRCDVCDTWVATHVVRGASMSFIVCDKPRCQDRVAEVLHTHSTIAQKIEDGAAMGDADWTDR